MKILIDGLEEKGHKCIFSENYLISGKVQMVSKILSVIGCIFIYYNCKTLPKVNQLVKVRLK